MRQSRYQSPNRSDATQDTLPRDTDCTILVRQSTKVQKQRNIHSAEVNPEDLVREACHRWGFPRERVQVIDRDMGIGAYSTTIEDRPGLKHWLFELLPSGSSRVLLVSQEDRLFRDRDEVEHNRFIRQVERYGGWVICGDHTYNFRQDFDRERFRQACKSGKDYIENHIKRRLHPAIQRAAMDGKYAGGPVPWGYVVDYDHRSPMYKHFLRYPPHATLVVEHIFQIFARMPIPSTVEVARHWAREGLVWPFFSDEVDPRRVRVVELTCARDEARGGYQFHFRQAFLILTNAAYVGWRVRANQVAWDEEQNAPRVCHEPLVDEDLFWWCFDRLVSERPPWAPARQSIPVAPAYRPRAVRRRQPEATPFLAPGLVRCAVHQQILGAVTYPDGSVLLRCHGNDRYRLETSTCSGLSAPIVDRALSAAFADQLRLDEHDLRELARLAQQREVQRQAEPSRIERQMAEQRTQLERAKWLAMKATDQELAAEYSEQAHQVKQTIRQLESELTALRARETPSVRAWALAERAVSLAELIRSSFSEWSRSAQMRVLVLALQEGVLGCVDRRTFGLWMRWRGGSESRRYLPVKMPRFLAWTDAEREALRQSYPILTWEALVATFADRTASAIKREAYRLRLSRPAGRPCSPVVATVFAAPPIENAMAAYGFSASADRAPPIAVTAALSGRVSRHSTRSCSCAR